MLLSLALSPVFAWALSSFLSDPLTAFQIAGVLDLAGLLAAIWMIWSTISLTLGGRLLLAFRFMAVGAFAFAFSHLIDTLVQASKVLDVEAATFLHQGVVSIAIFLFVAGLANLADDLPVLGASRQMTSSLRLWPLVVGAATCISALSFVLYGFSLVAEGWAFIWIDMSLIILLGVCLVLALRARLGGLSGARSGSLCWPFSSSGWPIRFRSGFISTRTLRQAPWPFCIGWSSSRRSSSLPSALRALGSKWTVRCALM